MNPGLLRVRNRPFNFVEIEKLEMPGVTELQYMGSVGEVSEPYRILLIQESLLLLTHFRFGEGNLLHIYRTFIESQGRSNRQN